jgi:hypothetical protein
VIIVDAARSGTMFTAHIIGFDFENRDGISPRLRIQQQAWAD